MIKGKIRGIVSWFFIVVALLLAGQAAQGVTVGQGDIPVTRWVDPLGRKPITFEEWRKEQPPLAPFVAKEICRRDHIIRELTFLGLAAAPPSAPKVVIIVNSALRPLIQPSLDQYVADLATEGYSVTLYETQGGTPNDLRTYLQGISGLVGAILIGDLPVPWYEMNDDFGNKYSQFPIDLYYMDLDGTWTDADNDGRYDGHSDGAGDRFPEIWVGRLTAGPLTGDEATLLQSDSIPPPLALSLTLFPSPVMVAISRESFQGRELSLPPPPPPLMVTAASSPPLPLGHHWLKK